MIIMPMPRTMPPMKEPALKPDESLGDAVVTVTAAVVSRLVLVSAADDNDDNDDDVSVSADGRDETADDNVVALLDTTHTDTHTYIHTYIQTDRHRQTQQHSARVSEFSAVSATELECSKRHTDRPVYCCDINIIYDYVLMKDHTSSV